MPPTFATAGSADLHTRLVSLLEVGGVPFRVVKQHQAGRSVSAGRSRMPVSQGTKAVACKLRAPGGANHHALAVIPSDKELSPDRLACLFGAMEAQPLSAADTEYLTACQSDAIPPFSFRQDVLLACDESLPNGCETIAFNAGRLDIAILMNAQDYVRIAKPVVGRFVA